MNVRVTVVMQSYDFLYHVVFQYIFLLSIQLCCYHTFPQRSYLLFTNLLLKFYFERLLHLCGGFRGSESHCGWSPTAPFTQSSGTTTSNMPRRLLWVAGDTDRCVISSSERSQRGMKGRSQQSRPLRKRLGTRRCRWPPAGGSTKRQVRYDWVSLWSVRVCVPRRIQWQAVIRAILLASCRREYCMKLRRVQFSHISRDWSFRQLSPSEFFFVVTVWSSDRNAPLREPFFQMRCRKTEPLDSSRFISIICCVKVSALQTAASTWKSSDRSRPAGANSAFPNRWYKIALEGLATAVDANEAWKN